MSTNIWLVMILSFQNLPEMTSVKKTHFKIVHTCMSMWVHALYMYGHGHAMAHGWKSDGKFQESACSVHNVGLGSWTLVSWLFTRCLHSLSCFHFKREKITLLFLNSRLHGFIKLSIKLYLLTLQILFPIRLAYLLDLFFNIQVKVSGITLHISQLLSLSQIPVIT